MVQSCADSLLPQPRRAIASSERRARKRVAAMSGTAWRLGVHRIRDGVKAAFFTRAALVVLPNDVRLERVAVEGELVLGRVRVVAYLRNAPAEARRVANGNRHAVGPALVTLGAELDAGADTDAEDREVGAYADTGLVANRGRLGLGVRRALLERQRPGRATGVARLEGRG